MKVFITGAAGFVGRHLISLLGQDGHRLFVYGRSVSALAADPVEGAWDAGLEDSGVLDDALAFAHPDIIVHLAGQTSVAASWADPRETFTANVMASLALWQSGRKAGVERWVNMGTAEAYAPKESPLGEEDPLSPVHPYGVSKVAQEWLFRQLAARDQLPLWHFRTFNLIGPGQDTRFVIPSLAAQIVSGQDPVRIGNLSPVRDFLDVRDAARILVQVVTGEIPAGIYNLCSGQGRSVQSVADDLCRSAHRASRLVLDPERLRPVDNPYLVGNPARLAAVLGRQPATIPWIDTLEAVLADVKRSANQEDRP